MVAARGPAPPAEAGPGPAAPSSFRGILVLSVLLYNFLYVCFDLLGASSWAGRADAFDPATVVLLTEVGKFSVSGLLYLLNKLLWAPRPLLAEREIAAPSGGGGKRPAGAAAAPAAAVAAAVAAEAGGAAKAEPAWTWRDISATFRSLTIPACCYSAIDVLNLRGLAYVSLSHYAALHQTGVFFTAVGSFVLLPNFALDAKKALGLLLLFGGGVLNALGDDWRLNDSAPTLTGVSIVVGAALISSFGTVVNEKVVRGRMSMDANLQNMLLYAQTATLLALRVLCGRALDGRSWYEAPLGLNWTVAGLVLAKVGLGLAVSRILKYGGAMTKQFSAALHIPLEVLVAHLVLRTHMGVNTLVGAVLISAATLVYYGPFDIPLTIRLGMPRPHSAKAFFEKPRRSV